MALLNRCIFNATSAGTGDFGVATPVLGFLTPAQANAQNATTYHYAAQTLDGSGSIIQWELGNGTYNAGVLARTTIIFSSSANAKVNFALVPQVLITALAEDIVTAPLTGAAASHVAIFTDTTGRQLADSKITLTTPATGATLTIADGKVITESNTLTYTGNDGSTVAFGAGGTVLYGNQTITLTGNVTGSGTTAITTTLATGSAGNLDSGTLLAARMPALTGDVTSTVNTVATTIANNAVTHAKAAQATANTLKGNPTGATANVTDRSH